jgi:hypothetical protein
VKKHYIKKYGVISDVVDRIIIPNPNDKASSGNKEDVVLSSEDTDSDCSDPLVSISHELAPK